MKLNKLKFPKAEPVKRIQGPAEERRFQSAAAKGFAALLIVMLAFTMISRAAASFTTAQVETESPSARKIDHTVTAEGTVEKNRELAVLTQPGLLVKTVYVSEGEKVSAGAELALLEPESIQEAIDGLENEIQILQLQNETANSNAAREQQERDTQRKRAKEDYQRTMDAQAALVAEAEERLKRAQEALAAFDQENDSTMQEEEKPSGDESQGGNTQESSGDESHSGNTQEPSGDALKSRTAARAELENAVNEAQNAYEAALRGQAQAGVEAARQVEDAAKSAAKDNSIQINNLSIEAKEKELKKLKELAENGGTVTSPTDGVVTQMALVTGQRTTDTAAVTMADLSSGMRYTAQISEEDGKYVAIGDPVTLKAGGKEYGDLQILSLEQDSQSNMITVTVLLEPDTLSIGDTAVFKTTKQSDSYPLTVPMSAVRVDNNKSFVLVIEEEETVLGVQLAARRIDVTVEDQNGLYAAISSEMLSESSRVITFCEDYVKAGDRVRLRES